jgi:hypothetical protein
MSNFLDDNKSLFLTPRVDQYNSHQVMTNVLKPTKKKYFNVNTEFCNEYTTNYTTENSSVNLSHTSASSTPVCSTNLASYTFTLPEKINEVKSISVKNIEIPITYYNISSLLGNNIFKITPIIPGSGFPTNGVFIIPDGTYDFYSLSDAINIILNVSTPQQIFFGYGNLNTKTTINPPTSANVNNNNSVFFNKSTTTKYQIDFAINNDGSFNKYNFKSSLGWMLGFRKNTYDLLINTSAPTITGSLNYFDNFKNTPLAKYILSESYINILGPKYFYLAIDEFSKGNQNSFISTLPFSLINKNIIAKISLGNSKYNTIFSANSYIGLLSDKREYNGKTDIQKLLVQLIDQYGNSVNLNGFDFSFCLEIEYEP